MREVNFSIPNVNKASVHITTTLYDRRALDCTSTLPLINSLNHLTNLTTSSGRIRDILVVDGGVERLVSILKGGKGHDKLDAWKWNLAFQCMVNVGVRGSEEVRTRVVEADLVPVIATLLDKYIQAVEERRAKAEVESAQPDVARLDPTSDGVAALRARPYASNLHHGISERRQSSRRQRPPALEIPHPSIQAQHAMVNGAMEGVRTSLPERTDFARQQSSGHHHHHHHHHRSQDSRSLPHRPHHVQSLSTAVASMDTADGFVIPPVRDVDRLPSMLPPLQGGNHSQPESPTTPLAPPRQQSSRSTNQRPRRPSLRQHRSNSVESDDAVGDDSAVSGDDANGVENERSVMDVQSGVTMANVGDGNALLDAENAPFTLTIPNVSEPRETETFNITHHNPVDGSIANPTATPVNSPLNFTPVPPPSPAHMPSPHLRPTSSLDSARNVASSPEVEEIDPRGEDVLMLLQLLAYVSKYCNLRPHFQATHLVPKLRSDWELRETADDSVEDCDEEFLQADDFNIFPLVEKFTVRHHSKDMQYWACVVMRNLCRRDDSRGGIRQCAYYACGKWEEYPRQFAKCRRCRRTKYCSKDCQKNAWVFHRHWCHTPSS